MMKYRLFCSSLSLYTHPIATTLQALSVWIICAFSIHRCRSIVRPSILLSSFRKEILKRSSMATNLSAPSAASAENTGEKQQVKRKIWPRFKSLFSTEKPDQPCPCCVDKQTRSKDSRDYFFQISFKNNINQQSYYLKFYKQSIACIFAKCFDRKRAPSGLAINECAMESLHNPSCEKFNENTKAERSCLVCFCSCKKQTDGKDCLKIGDKAPAELVTEAPRPSQVNGLDSIIKPPSTMDLSKMSFRRLSTRYKFSSSSLNSLNRTRYTITGLYLVALVYLIPQMFEKKSVVIQVQKHVYFYKEITEFGQSRLYRHFYHLWFYLLAIYILPFTFIFVSNLLLLRVYLKSKRRCQRYHMRSSTTIFREATSNSISAQNPPTQMRQDSNNFTMQPLNEQTQRSSNNVAFVNDHSTSSADTANPQSLHQPKMMPSIKKNRLSVNLAERHLSFAKRPTLERSSSLISERSSSGYLRRRSFRFGNAKNSASAISANVTSSSTSNSSKPSRALTLTLFGVVAIFFICNLPAAMARIVYVIYPKSEFQNKNLTAIYMGVANFLIMLNSSINFIPYIVFGPGKFRDEFRVVCFSILNALARCLQVFRFLNIFGKKRPTTTFTTTNSTVLAPQEQTTSCECDNCPEHRPRLGSLI